MKALLPITLIITIWQTLFPMGIFSFTNSISMIITSVLVYSIGWVLSGQVYRQNSANYSLARHVGLASLFSVPIVAIIFVPSFLYPYIVGKAFTFRFLAIISFCSFVFLSLTNESFKPRVTPFVVGYSLFAFIMLLSVIFSIDPARSFWSNYERMEGYINLVSLLVLAISATSMRLGELEWDRIFGVHLFVSTFVSGFAVIQYMIGSMGLKMFANTPILSLCLSQGSACRVDSTLGNSIYLGIYSAMTFWLIIYAIFGKKVRGNLLPFLAVLNILAVYFSGTRGVWLGMFLGLGVLIISKYWFDGNKKAVAGTIIGGVMFLAIFAGFIIYAKKNNFAQDVAIVARFSSVNTLFARWNIWKTAVISWEQKPVLGWGQENFIHAFNLNYNPAMYGQETYFDHPHNTYFGWLVFGGLLGFLAFLFMLFTSIYGIVKSNRAEEKENDLVIPIILALLVTYFTHIFFVFDNLTSSLLFVMTIVYFSSKFTFGDLNLPTFKPRSRQAVALALCLVGVYFVFIAIYKPSKANMETIFAMTYQQRANTNNPVEILKGTQKAYEDAINENTFGTYEIREFYLQKSLDFVKLQDQVTDESVKAAIIAVGGSALNQFKDQVEKNPFDHRARFMLGLYYLQTKQFDLAVQTLEEAVKLAPNKQIALIYLAKAYLFKGDIANAAQYYERAINVTPNKIAGYNQIRIEYISVLLLANQDERAMAIIKDLMPTATREDFNSLVQQMTQVYSQRKDLKGIIKTLNDAITLDPTNQNFILWLAQAYVATGQYDSANFTINKLYASNPQVVAQFTQQLNEYIKTQQNAQQEAAAQEKTQSTPAKTPAKTK